MPLEGNQDIQAKKVMEVWLLLENGLIACKDHCSNLVMGQSKLNLKIIHKLYCFRKSNNLIIQIQVDTKQDIWLLNLKCWNHKLGKELESLKI